jgi:Hydrolase of X-linked nucleoside diphosphate N terminal
MDPDWLRWVKRLQAIAQDGLTYAGDDYDAGRYEQVRKIAAEILAVHSTGGLEDARELLDLEVGPATPKVDVRAAAFRSGEMPELSLSRVTPAQIKRFFEHHRRPELPADFD